MNLGIARGFIEVGLQRLQQQRTLVVNTSRQMGQSIEKAFKGGVSAVQSFERRIDSLNARIKSVQGELTTLAVGGAALSGFGLKAADNLQVLEVRFREITGSQEEALKLMNQLADAAVKTGLPVRQTQQDFAGLVPIIRESGEDLEQYLNLVSRLTVLNPAEGTSGAVFAIREALASGGTDLVSLSERFNIPRKALRELIEETGSFADALDISLDKLGATTEAAEANAKSLRGASARFRDAGTRALERGFTPYVEGAALALDTLANSLDAVPDGLVAIGGGAAIAVTGFAAVTLAVSQLVTSYQNLKKAGFFEGISNLAKNKGFQRAGVTVGALGVGALGGREITRAIGRETGDERLANFELKDAIKPLREALALIIDLVLQAFQQLVRAIGRVIAVFLNIPNTLKIMEGQLAKGFAGILVAIGNFIASIPGQGELGRRISDEGQGLQTEAQSNIDAARNNAQSNVQALDDAVVESFENFRLNALRAIGGVDEAASDSADSVEESAESIADSFANAAQAALNAQNEEYLAGLQERINFEQEYTKLLREGTPEQIQDRIQAFADEKAAIEQFLPQLREIAATSEDGAERLAEYESRLATINEQAERLSPALIDAARNAINALDSDFASQVAAIESEREKALNEAMTALGSELSNLDADILEQSKELRAENIEALQEYQNNERKIVQEHRDKVLEIERRGREDILDAAARLDASGVFAARKNREDQLTEENKRFAESRAKNQERLQESQTALNQEAQQLQAYYIQRRNELIAQNQADVQQLNAKFNAEIQTAQNAYQQERSQLQAHIQAQLQARYQGQLREQSILQQGLNAAQQQFQQFVNGVQSALNGTNQVASQIGSQITRAANGRSVSGGANAGGSLTPAFNTGGVAAFSGSGSALALVENKERILTPQQNANFERFINAISGSGTGQATPTLPSNLSIDVTGVDSFEMLVAQVTRNVLGQIYSQQITG